MLKEIEGKEQYFISDLGEVFSDKWTHKRKLKPQPYPNGYLFITFSYGKTQTTQMIHRLVAIAFIPNPENKETVNHKNGIKTDNRVENLEWATQGENNTHAYRTGLKKHHRCWLGKSGVNHNKSKTVIELDLIGNELNRYGSTKEASRILKLHHSAIQYSIAKNKERDGRMYKYA